MIVIYSRLRYEQIFDDLFKNSLQDGCQNRKRESDQVFSQCWHFTFDRTCAFKTIHFGIITLAIAKTFAQAAKKTRDS